MRHEAGLSKLRQQVNVKWTSRENIKANVLGEII